MVKEIRRETVKYACKICGSEFDTKKNAEKCENSASEKWGGDDYWYNKETTKGDLILIWRQDEYLPARKHWDNAYHIAKIVGWHQWSKGHILHPIVKILDTEEREEVIIPYISEKQVSDGNQYSISIERYIGKDYKNKILKWAELIREGKI